MEMPWHNLFSEMGMEDEGEFFNEQRHNNVNSFDHDDDEALILGDILQLQYSAFSSESESLSPQTHNNKNSSSAIGGSSSTLSFDHGIIGFNNNDDDNNNSNKRCKILSKSSSSNSIASQLVPLETLPADAETNSSPKSCILSFDDASATQKQQGGGRGRCSSSRGGGRANCSNQQRLSGAKKTRNFSESLDHIMAERKRRQELTERFIALSATIPGLKKIDKASILSEAINYVKQLQERVKKLEDESSSKVKVESFMISNKKAGFNNSGTGTEEGTASSKTNTSSSSDDEYCHRSLNNNNNDDALLSSLPEVEARALENQVLLRIHCQKQSGVMLNILAHLKALDLSVISKSVLPFGNSALDITIIAQMGDKYRATVKELVKSMRMSLLVESPDDILQQQ